MLALLRKSTRTAARAMVAPFLAPGAGAAVWWTHAAVVGATLVGLWRLNAYLQLDRLVHAPSLWVRSLWLPILFGIAYAAAWAGRLAWRALNEPEAASPFPDLDEAWRHASAGLARGGVALGEKPLVLVLGQPAERDNLLLGALGVVPTCGPTPDAPHAPLRLAADSRAVYLLCHDASVLSLCGERIAQRRRSLSKARPVAQAAEARMPVALRVGADGADDAHEPHDEQPAWHAGGEAAAPEDNTPLAERGEALRARQRLEHLLKVVRRDLAPHTPIDAIALVVPCDVAASSVVTPQVGQAIRQDLAAVAEAAGVRCPVGVVLSELQHVDGCGALLHALPSERRSRRLGVDLQADTTTTSYAVAEALDWLIGELTPALCGRLYHADDDLTDNASLFALQSSLADRSGRFAEVVSTGLAVGGPDAWPLSGCHLVATGDPLGGSQAFGAGVLDRLTDSPSHARWTPAAIACDRWAEKWARRGYVGLAATAAAIAALLVL